MDFSSLCYFKSYSMSVEHLHCCQSVKTQLAAQTSLALRHNIWNSCFRYLRKHFGHISILQPTESALPEVCSLGCQGARHRAVCGTKGRLYKSVCAFQRARCINSQLRPAPRSRSLGNTIMMTMMMVMKLPAFSMCTSV